MTPEARSAETASSNIRRLVIEMPAEDLNLLERRKSIVQQTWRAVEMGLGMESTKAFYERLFEKHPSVRDMFVDDINAQAQKLYEVLRVAIRFLDRLDELLPILRDMGVRHGKSYGVVRAHYEAVTEVFIEILTTYIVAEFPSELSHSIWKMDVADGWGWVLSFIGKTMADAADEAIAAEKDAMIYALEESDVSLASGQAAQQPARIAPHNLASSE